MTMKNPKATYACLNAGEAYAPEEIGARSICVNGDVGETLDPHAGIVVLSAHSAHDVIDRDE